MKNIYRLIIILSLPLLFTACSKMEDFYLSETIFIEDQYYPGLPIYSEWGYNTFGAYIDRKPFISTRADLPVKIIVNTDTLHMIMRGRMEGQEVDIKFSVKGFSPASHFDMISMDNTTVNLGESGRRVSLTIDGRRQVLDIIEGELIFNKVQLLYVDEDLTRTIISGYFRLKTFLDEEPVAISYGRFDFGIGYENFYNYSTLLLN